jgi:hypothetical protein
MPSITLTQIGTYVFPPAPAGYEEQPALPVAVFNTGGAATGALSITLSGMAEAFFIYPSSLESIGPSGSAYFSVAPAVGLAAGVYSATVTVGSASGSAGIVPQSTQSRRTHANMANYQTESGRVSRSNLLSDTLLCLDSFEIIRTHSSFLPINHLKKSGGLS